MSLNSIPLPVQAMKWELVGLSNRATRNCQSWSDPRLWYGGPSRYPPASCLMSPAEKNKQDISKDNSAKTTGEKRKKKKPSTFHTFYNFTNVHLECFSSHKTVANSQATLPRAALSCVTIKLLMLQGLVAAKKAQKVEYQKAVYEHTGKNTV